MQRRVLARPAKGVVYELTARPRSEDSVLALGRWGAVHLGDPRPEETVTLDSLAWPCARRFVPKQRRKSEGVRVARRRDRGARTRRQRARRRSPKARCPAPISRSKRAPESVRSMAGELSPAGGDRKRHRAPHRKPRAADAVRGDLPHRADARDVRSPVVVARRRCAARHRRRHRLGAARLRAPAAGDPRRSGRNLRLLRARSARSTLPAISAARSRRRRCCATACGPRGSLRSHTSLVALSVAASAAAVGSFHCWWRAWRSAFPAGSACGGRDRNARARGGRAARVGERDRLGRRGLRARRLGAGGRVGARRSFAVAGRDAAVRAARACDRRAGAASAPPEPASGARAAGDMPFALARLAARAQRVLRRRVCVVRDRVHRVRDVRRRRVRRARRSAAGSDRGVVGARHRVGRGRARRRAGACRARRPLSFVLPLAAGALGCWILGRPGAAAPVAGAICVGIGLSATPALRARLRACAATPQPPPWRSPR